MNPLNYCFNRVQLVVPFKIEYQVKFDAVFLVMWYTQKLILALVCYCHLFLFLQGNKILGSNAFVISFCYFRPGVARLFLLAGHIEKINSTVGRIKNLLCFLT